MRGERHPADEVSLVRRSSSGLRSACKARLSSELAGSLLRLSDHLPAHELRGGLLREDLWVRCRSAMMTLAGAGELSRWLDEILVDDGASGFAVLDCRELVGRCEPGNLEPLLTALLSLMGRPLRVFDQWPLWKPLGTKLCVEPMRAMGVGYNPLHIDVVNSTCPPDFAALLCARPDPLGGGHSLVAPLREALRRLPGPTVELLSEPVYRDGEFFDLSGVGEEYSPFPIVDGEPESKGFVRFTAKMLPERDPMDPHMVAARALEAELLAMRRRFLLCRGDLLIVNQHLVCHGRESLGHDQANLPEEQRRLMLQIFLRGQQPPGQALPEATS